MVAATVTSKGQITVPASVRAALGLRQGSVVEFVELPDGTFAVRAQESPVAALRGIAGTFDTAVSLDQMDMAVERGAIESGQGSALESIP